MAHIYSHYTAGAAASKTWIEKKRTNVTENDSTSKYTTAPLKISDQ
jgi:hypothetical protein